MYVSRSKLFFCTAPQIIIAFIVICHSLNNSSAFLGTDFGNETGQVDETATP